MKLILETRKDTEARKEELKKLKGYLESFYNKEDPFNCHCSCEEDCNTTKDECVKKYIQDRINKINEEGVWYI